MPKLFKERNGMYGKSQSAEARTAISNFRKNTRWMFDPIARVQKAIDKEAVEEYLAKGWKLGRLRYQKDPDFLLSF